MTIDVFLADQALDVPARVCHGPGCSVMASPRAPRRPSSPFVPVFFPAPFELDSGEAAGWPGSQAPIVEPPRETVGESGPYCAVAGPLGDANPLAVPSRLRSSSFSCPRVRSIRLVFISFHYFRINSNYNDSLSRAIALLRGSPVSVLGAAAGRTGRESVEQSPVESV